tara:strand:- start:121 stop:783 length:663 start_codon:yes stop_codon:yes gene_type:complete
MGLLDVDKFAIAPTVTKQLRQTCETYESAYAYFVERVEEQDEDDEWTWVQHDNVNGWSVQINLATQGISMPLYWKQEVLQPEQYVDIKDPDGNVIEQRRRSLGFTKYEVSSVEAGIDLLKALAKDEDPDFKAILTDAADAIKDVKTVEQPNIRKKAEMLYSAWLAENPDSTLGEWAHKDSMGKSGAEVYSKEKTNKMNQFKQTARRQLGYDRAKVQIELR